MLRAGMKRQTMFKKNKKFLFLVMLNVIVLAIPAQARNKKIKYWQLWENLGCVSKWNNPEAECIRLAKAKGDNVYNLVTPNRLVLSLVGGLSYQNIEYGSHRYCGSERYLCQGLIRLVPQETR